MAFPQNCCNERQIRGWRIWGPVPRRHCLMKGGNSKYKFFLRTGWTTNRSGRAEINKPTFGQGKGLEDIVHSLSPLLSIIRLHMLIFGTFLKSSLHAHTNLDDAPAERCQNKNWDVEGTLPPSVLPLCLTLSCSHPTVLAKTVHLQIQLMVIHLLHNAQILDCIQYAKNAFILLKDLIHELRRK